MLPQAGSRSLCCRKRRRSRARPCRRRAGLCKASAGGIKLDAGEAGDEHAAGRAVHSGWLGPRARAREANAVALGDTPNFDRIWASCPHAQLAAHGPDVGLPEGQMGNSEVGHTNIGAGRVVWMDLPRIDNAIADGSFASNAGARRASSRR